MLTLTEIRAQAAALKADEAVTQPVAASQLPPLAETGSHSFSTIRRGGEMIVTAWVADAQSGVLLMAEVRFPDGDLVAMSVALADFHDDYAPALIAALRRMAQHDRADAQNWRRAAELREAGALALEQHLNALD